MKICCLSFENIIFFFQQALPLESSRNRIVEHALKISFSGIRRASCSISNNAFLEGRCRSQHLVDSKDRQN
jgi:hypothetical protein